MVVGGLFSSSTFCRHEAMPCPVHWWPAGVAPWHSAHQHHRVLALPVEVQRLQYPQPRKASAASGISSLSEPASELSLYSPRSRALQKRRLNSEPSEAELRRPPRLPLVRFREEVEEQYRGGYEAGESIRAGLSFLPAAPEHGSNASTDYWL